jgi:hypothetical protein
MSLSTLATTNFSSRHDATLPPSAFELRHIMTDYPAVGAISHSFRNDPLALERLHHMAYIAQNIERLQAELDRHHIEEEEFYNRMMENEEFRKKLQPIVHRYRRSSREKGFHPYNNRPLAPTPPPRRHRNNRPTATTPPPPSTSPKSQKSEQSSPSSNVYRTADSTSYETGMSLIEAYLLEEREREAQKLPGTSQNPILVEETDDDEPIPPESNWRPSPPTFQSICEKCGAYGHEEDACDTPPHRFMVCKYCVKMMQNQRLCTHFYRSKKSLKRLRLRLQMPDSSDD